MISLKELFMAPAVSLTLATLAGGFLATLLPATTLIWVEFILKSLTFGLIYGMGLFILERKNLVKLLNDLFRLMDPRITAKNSTPLSGDEP